MLHIDVLLTLSQQHTAVLSIKVTVLCQLCLCSLLKSHAVSVFVFFQRSVSSFLGPCAGTPASGRMAGAFALPADHTVWLAYNITEQLTLRNVKSKKETCAPVAPRTLTDLWAEALQPQTAC